MLCDDADQPVPGPVDSPDYNAGTCLAFDYGSRRIGLAIGNSMLQSARPLAVVRNTNGTPDWDSVVLHIRQWQPVNLIVGWPLNEAGLEQPLCNHVKGFSKQLVKRFSLPVHLVDERYSSMAAQEEVKTLRQRGQMKRQSKHEDIDSMAAALILETWFSQNAT